MGGLWRFLLWGGGCGWDGGLEGRGGLGGLFVSFFSFLVWCF